MGKQLSLRLFLASILVGHITLAQENKTREIALKDTPTAYSYDIQGNIYLGYRDGSLEKYDAFGALSESFSLPNHSPLTLIEAQNPLKIFLFYRDNQQVVMLDRFSSVPKTYALSRFGLDIVQMACPDVDGTFWTVESNPLRVKKVDPIRGQTIVESQLDLGDSTLYMKVYQNTLLILDEKGVHILDQFGDITTSVTLPSLSFFIEKQGRLASIFQQNIISIDPFNGTWEKSTEEPLLGQLLLANDDSRTVLLDQNLLIIQKKQ